MFIKLTRFDNRPIWLNASFIVTVEPRKEGAGSVIVPIGDGFDYDVRESVEEILGMLDGVPMAAVVPVPASDCLTKMPADVSPEPEPKREMPEGKPCSTEKSGSAEEKTPRKRATRAKAKAEKQGKPAPLELSEEQVVRLVKLAPKSVAKLKNTLATQFHVADVGATVQELERKGAMTLDGSRVFWSPLN